MNIQDWHKEIEIYKNIENNLGIMASIIGLSIFTIVMK